MFLDRPVAFDWPLVGRDATQSFGETLEVDNRTTHHLFISEIMPTSVDTATATWPMEDYA
ncbi:hypothetical protein [Pseudonocardia xishanensis]|uniref:Uncharacterized protein n=1 Tax=Pseudonocardia xishanensis TaxID=630995 RepID=A0ABP8RX22_9PSEU